MASTAATTGCPTDEVLKGIRMERLTGLILVSDTIKGIFKSIEPLSAPSLDSFPIWFINVSCRGVFTTAPVCAGTIIETCPLLIILSPKIHPYHSPGPDALPHLAPAMESARSFPSPLLDSSLYVHHCKWPIRLASGRQEFCEAVVFGLGSMFNHSRRMQNVGWERDVDRKIITYRALRRIEAGEELCISYGDRLTFVDAENHSGEVHGEKEDDLINNIQLDL